MMKNIAIVVKPHAEEVADITIQICDYLKSEGKNVLLEERTASVLGYSDFTTHNEIKDNADLLIVLGGDGTLISSNRIISGANIPILGVNLGRLGFLTETKVEEALDTVKKVLSGNYKFDNRMKLISDIFYDEEKVFTTEVLNDIVINKGALARIIDIEVHIDNQYVNTYRADGLIISTPTGSTAYTLAAGGPIVYPTLNSIILTPICPHSLTHRPIVIHDDSEIKIRILNDDEKVFITYDGQIGRKMSLKEEIFIYKSPQPVKLIVSQKRNYFALLKEKLGWGST
ncbi:inorganic polyphosphate/ATP-NAD kinase [Flexistipes sinusarabici DSM 4947]|uniref:NAD kinase n=2 Tax=Flexistipes sinusarabici TaxID=2352 RepID=F8E763_FLESM|nr:NAD(+)/NADH kinase [Flexistipes sinusarabici]AEI14926.1 inorganic polyphosphate/ATP-NAD kinase [Flexistipes sinusarabici DSM 4947]